MADCPYRDQFGVNHCCNNPNGPCEDCTYQPTPEQRLRTLEQAREVDREVGGDMPDYGFGGNND